MLMNLDTTKTRDRDIRNWAAFFFYSNYLLMLILSFIGYAFYAFQLLVIMFFRHDLAFKNHAPRMIPLILTTLVAIVFVCWKSFDDFGFYLCFDFFHDFSGSFCNTMASTFFKSQYNQQNSLIFSRYVPIMAFLVLNWPHDCYRCLGKDPDRIFSIHQLTKEEKTLREIRNKYGEQRQMFDSIDYSNPLEISRYRDDFERKQNLTFVRSKVQSSHRPTVRSARQPLGMVCDYELVSNLDKD